MVRMELFRSAEMNLIQLIIPSESAHDTVTYLAELGLIQFKDVWILLPVHSRLAFQCLGLNCSCPLSDKLSACGGLAMQSEIRAVALFVPYSTCGMWFRVAMM